MNNVMTCYVPAVKKHFSPVNDVISLSDAQAEIHLDEFCPEWVYGLKTRRDAIESLMESGYQPDFIQSTDGSTDYRLAAYDGRYFSITATMFEYAVSLQGRDTKGFYFHKILAKEGKQIEYNHEMAYC
ncbi:hypothetical protein [Erwinia amylovora]|uniref:hypothetical protein n=1 Tax=Erwinia amylovora TaxID=552 RepID=UPI0020BE1242|nr:hypothetical protein [Erwinia amylovora]MCK8417636.1 hypothetical protein [Erwinia amylovora]